MRPNFSPTTWLIAAGTCAAAALGAYGLWAGDGSPPAPAPQSLAPTAPIPVRQGGLQHVQPQVASPQYAVQVNDQGQIEARNQWNEFTATVTDDGLAVRPESSEASFSLRLTGIGRGTDLTAPGRADEIRYEGNAIERRWQANGLSEWFVNRNDGLEQGWTFEQRPEGSGELVLELDWELPAEVRLSQDADGIRIAGLTRRPLHYRDLAVWDADGRELPARMELVGRDVRLAVNDAQARYPVVVDPTFVAANQNGQYAIYHRDELTAGPWEYQRGSIAQGDADQLFAAYNSNIIGDVPGNEGSLNPQVYLGAGWTRDIYQGNKERVFFDREEYYGFTSWSESSRNNTAYGYSRSPTIHFPGDITLDFPFTRADEYGPAYFQEWVFPALDLFDAYKYQIVKITNLSSDVTFAIRENWPGSSGNGVIHGRVEEIESLRDQAIDLSWYHPSHYKKEDVELFQSWIYTGVPGSLDVHYVGPPVKPKRYLFSEETYPIGSFTTRPGADFPSSASVWLRRYEGGKWTGEQMQHLNGDAYPDLVGKFEIFDQTETVTRSSFSSITARKDQGLVFFLGSASGIELPKDVILRDDSYIVQGESLAAGTPVIIAYSNGVFANDDLGAIELVMVDPGSHGPKYGDLEFHSDGSFIYTPSTAFFDNGGRDEFYYVYSDEYFENIRARVSIVGEVPDPEIADDGPYSVAVGEVLSIPASQGLLVNDRSTWTGHSLVCIPDEIGGSDYGSLSVSKDGSFLFVADEVIPESVTSEDITYIVAYADFPSKTWTGTVTIAFEQSQDLVANNDSYGISEPEVGVAVRFERPLTANDEGDLSAARVTKLSNPSHGSVEVRANGIVIYTPTDAGFDGTDSFTYKIEAGSQSDTATVEIGLGELTLPIQIGVLSVDGSSAQKVGGKIKVFGTSGDPLLINSEVLITGTEVLLDMNAQRIDVAQAVSVGVAQAVDAVERLVDLPAGSHIDATSGRWSWIGGEVGLREGSLISPWPFVRLFVDRIDLHHQRNGKGPQGVAQGAFVVDVRLELDAPALNAGKISGKKAKRYAGIGTANKAFLDTELRGIGVTRAAPYRVLPDYIKVVGKELVNEVNGFQVGLKEIKVVLDRTDADAQSLQAKVLAYFPMAALRLGVGATTIKNPIIGGELKLVWGGDQGLEIDTLGAGFDNAKIPFFSAFTVDEWVLKKMYGKIEGMSTVMTPEGFAPMKDWELGLEGTIACNLNARGVSDGLGEFAEFTGTLGAAWANGRPSAFDATGRIKWVQNFVTTEGNVALRGDYYHVGGTAYIALDWEGRHELARGNVAINIHTLQNALGAQLALGAYAQVPPGNMLYSALKAAGVYEQAQAEAGIAWNHVQTKLNKLGIRFTVPPAVPVIGGKLVGMQMDLKGNRAWTDLTDAKLLELIDSITGNG